MQRIKTIRGALGRHPDVSLVTAFVVLSGLVQLMVRPNPRWNDGILMLRYARDFPDVPANHFTLRIGLLLPARLFEDIFGYGQVAYYAFPYLAGLLLVAATYFLARELLGRWAACFAATVTVFNPMLVDTQNFPSHGIERMTSWQLLTDIPSTALFTLGLALLLHGAHRVVPDAKGKLTPGTGWLLAAGFCLGWAYWIRETTPLLFPIVGLVLVLWRISRRGWLLLGGTMAAALVIELIANAGLYGDAFARFHAGSEQGGVPDHPLTRIIILEQLVKVIRENQATALWLLALMLTIGTAVWLRRRQYVVLAAWLVLYWLEMLYLGGILHPGHVKLQAGFQRYWLPVAPVLAIGAAGGLQALWATVRARYPRPFLQMPRTTALATGVALAAFCVPVFPEIVGNPRDRIWNDTRTYLHNHNAEIRELVTDRRDASNLDIYSRSLIGGHLVWDGALLTVPSRLRTAPDAGPGQWLLWTRQLCATPPTPDTGWVLAFKQGPLSIFRSTVQAPP